MSALASDSRPPGGEEASVCCRNRPGSRRLKQPPHPPLPSSAWLLSLCWLQTRPILPPPLRSVPGHLVTVRVSLCVRSTGRGGPGSCLDAALGVS